MTAELKGIHAKTFQDLDVIKDVLKLDEEKIADLENENKVLTQNLEDSEIIIAGLKAQIEKMKNCRNCKNEKTEGACGHFTQVGWCKNWELAK